MTYQCELKEQKEQNTLSVRTRAAVQDLPEVFGKAFGEIFHYLEELGEKPAAPPFGAYYNMDMQDMDLEIGVPVSRKFPPKGNVQPGLIPAGKTATCLYTGPYSEVEPAYNALMQWIQEKGYEMSGPGYEFYLNDPADTAPQDLQTQIVFPLKE